jgi:hypothetical protein
MKKEHRSALLALAADRGQKGFSSVLSEAIERYLDDAQKRAERRKRLLELQGSISSREAARLRSAVKKLRENWR